MPALKRRNKRRIRERAEPEGPRHAHGGTPGQNPPRREAAPHSVQEPESSPGRVSLKVTLFIAKK